MRETEIKNNSKKNVPCLPAFPSKAPMPLILFTPAFHFSTFSLDLTSPQVHSKAAKLSVAISKSSDSNSAK